MIAADEIEPGKRTAGEILGLQIIGRHLIGDRRQEASDEPHVVIPGQPGNAAIGIDQLHAVAVRGEIVEQRAVRDDHAVRETGRSAGILQVRDIVRAGFGKWRIRRVAVRQRFPIDRLATDQPGGFAGHFRKLGRKHQQRGLAARQLDAQLLDVGIAAAKRGGQRQRYRPGTGIDRAEEQGGELRTGFGDQRDPVTRCDAGGDQPARRQQRILAQLGERIGPQQCAARIVEIEPTKPLRGIIERIAKRFEIGEATWQAVIGWRRRHAHARAIKSHIWFSHHS